MLTEPIAVELEDVSGACAGSNPQAFCAQALAPMRYDNLVMQNDSVTATCYATKSGRFLDATCSAASATLHVLALGLVTLMAALSAAPAMF
jgi:hypothetical protein